MRSRAAIVLETVLTFTLVAAVVSAFDPGQVTKSIGGRVLKATIWSQGSPQVVRVAYQGDSLPDSISVALELSPGDTVRIVYKVPVDPAFDRALHQIYEDSR